MVRLFLGAVLVCAGLSLLGGCATDTDFSGTSGAGANADVPGASKPPPESTATGWKW